MANGLRKKQGNNTFQYSLKYKVSQDNSNQANEEVV